MPKGPNGQKRPGDVIGAAIMVARIATGEETEASADDESALQRKGGKRGGVARAKKLSPERRAEIAKQGAATRWAAKTDGS